MSCHFSLHSTTRLNKVKNDTLVGGCSCLSISLSITRHSLILYPLKDFLLLFGK